MAAFAYRVRDKAGKTVDGTIEGDSSAAVATKLRQMGYIVLDVGEKKEGLKREITIPGLGGRIKSKDLTVFSRQFATMINSGLSLTRCLSILAEQTQSRALAKVVGKLKGDVEGGQSLSEAMAKHPKAFPPLFVNMVRAGETGGVLDEVLLRVAEHFEKEAGIKSKIKSAMAYPIAMLGFTFLITFVLITFIVPMFVGMFEQVGGELPLPTLILLKTSGAIKSFWWLGLAIIIGCIYSYRFLKARETSGFQIDRIKLHLPIFGPLIRKTVIARFSRTFSTLIASGVPILQALDIVGETAGNYVVRKGVQETRASIKEGETIARPLGETGIFPPMVVQMIAVGEETGALDSMLSKIADFYDEEVSAAVEALTSIIEPALIVIMGVLVGGIIISIYLPMFKIVTMME